LRFYCRDILAPLPSILLHERKTIPRGEIASESKLIGRKDLSSGTAMTPSRISGYRGGLRPHRNYADGEKGVFYNEATAAAPDIARAPGNRQAEGLGVFRADSPAPAFYLYGEPFWKSLQHRAIPCPGRVDGVTFSISRASHLVFGAGTTALSTLFIDFAAGG